MEDIDLIPSILTKTIEHLLINTGSSVEQNDIQKIALIANHYDEICTSKQAAADEAQSEATSCQKRVEKYKEQLKKLKNEQKKDKQLIQALEEQVYNQEADIAGLEDITNSNNSQLRKQHTTILSLEHRLSESEESSNTEKPLISHPLKSATKEAGLQLITLKDQQIKKISQERNQIL